MFDVSNHNGQNSVSDESIDDFQIYSLEALFGALRNAAAQNVNDRSIPLVVAENAFAKDVFSSVQGIECNVSEEVFIA